MLKICSVLAAEEQREQVRQGERASRRFKVGAHESKFHDNYNKYDYILVQNITYFLPVRDSISTTASSLYDILAEMFATKSFNQHFS